MSNQLELKKAEFRSYLEQNGIVEALTKVIVGLYEEAEKPEKPLEYIKSLLTGPNDPDTETLIQENNYLKEKVAELEVLVRQLSSDPTEVVDAE